MHFLAQYSDSSSDAATGLAAMMIFFLLFLAVGFVLWLWAFISTVTKPAPVWEHAGQNKALWVVLQLGLGVLGAVGYLVAVRGKLIASQAALYETPQYFPPPQPQVPTGVGGPQST